MVNVCAICRSVLMCLDTCIYNKVYNFLFGVFNCSNCENWLQYAVNRPQ